VLDQVIEIPLPGRTLRPSVRDHREPAAAVTLPAFVAGPENRLVASTFCRLLQAESALTHGIAPATSRQLPRILSLFGRTGTGKTHLARGLVRHWQRSRGTAEAEYLTAQDFRHQLHDAINTNSVGEFRHRIRSLELLAIDDVYRFPKDPHLMQELRYTIDAFEEAAATLLVTSNRPISMLPNLPPDIRTRLAAGLMLQLAPPGGAARLRIVRHVSNALNKTFSDDAAQRLAETANGSASQLLGALLGADERLAGTASDDHVLNKRATRPPTMREIIAVVAKYYKLPQKLLRSSSRKRSAVLARATVVALARELTGESYEQIGRALGGRDHTTIMHNYQMIERQRQHDLAIQESLDDLRRVLLCH